MGLNTIIDELHNNLINDINKSQLPIGIIYYIVKDVFSNVSDAYKETLIQEQLENKKTPVEEEKEESQIENDEN